MIQYNEKQQLFHLSTPKTSYCFAAADGLWLGHLYYGPRLVDTAGMEQAFCLNEFPFSPAVNEPDKVRFTQIFPYEYGCFGTGDYREACFDAANALGMRGVDLTFRSFEEVCQ